MIWLGAFLSEWKGFGECCRQALIDSNGEAVLRVSLWVTAILAGVMVFLRLLMRTALLW